MQTIVTLLLIAVSAHAVLAVPFAESLYVVKSTHEAPKAWTRLGRADGSMPIQLHIGLRQARFHDLEHHLHQISDPDHCRYGSHMTAAQVNQLVAPAPETADLVHHWLRHYGVDMKHLEYTPSRDWITIRVPLEFAERLLDTKYHNYQHHDGSLVTRTTSWSIPRHLHAHIDTIQPTNSFYRVGQQAIRFVEDKVFVTPQDYTTPSDPAIAKACNISSVTPECFATLYKTKEYRTQASCRNSVAFTNYLGEVPIRPDTKMFLDKYQPQAVAQAYSFKSFSIAAGPTQDGPLTLNQSLAGLSFEANLDVQAIAGISNNTPITSFSTGGSPPFESDINSPTNMNEPYLVWASWLLQQQDIPHVISSSYADDEQTVPRDYAERVCKMFAQIGARGTTLFFASGDNGLGSPDTCFTNDGKNTTRFTPSFPASCPYVTTVGATMNFQPEVSAFTSKRDNATGAELLYASGSGFSDYFERPEWQSEVVSHYVAGLNGQYNGLFNPQGRAYPDLSAQGLHFAHFWNGTEGTISGTSASTPLVAGIFSLINDARLANNQSSLGYLNPWLYKKGYQGLNDITIGTSHGCNVDGFPVTAGWDPVTGFGTPNFPLLLQAAGVES